MSDIERDQTSPDREMIESVWAEARDMVRRLEGSSVQRFAVAAGEYKIEIERGAAAVPPTAGPTVEDRSLSGAVRGMSGQIGMVTGGRGASGVHMFEPPADNRIPVLAPLVGTFYRSSQPGAKAFVDVGDTVEPDQTVCIVEAMKMMNEVAAPEAGKVATFAVENGEWVEFEQVLMYLEPSEG